MMTRGRADALERVIMEYVVALLASIIVLIYVVGEIRFRRHREVRSRMTFRPHTTAQGEFMCFCMTAHASVESESTHDRGLPSPSRRTHLIRLRRRVVIACMMVLAAGLSAAASAEASDPSVFKACEVVTGKDVAGMAKGKLSSPPLGGAQACAYLVELADGTVESYRFSIQTPAGIEAMWKSQTAAERGEAVPGLWDEAHVAKQFMASGLSLTVVKRNDLAIEVTGERKDVLVTMAKLAISRLH